MLPGSPRISWWDVPDEVRAAVDDALGDRVVHATTADGGFSPGAAAIVETERGQRAFVKSVGVELNAGSVELHRREAATMRVLPAGLPAPDLRFVHDTGTWMTLVFDVVDGCPPQQPWVARELDLVLGAVDRVAATPAPRGLVPFEVLHESLFTGWRDLANGDGIDEVDAIDAWSRANVERLAEMETSWQAAARGDAVVHSDVRADNALVARDGVVLVDWAHASRGAAWIDLLLMAPAVEVFGGPSSGELWSSRSIGRAGDRDAEAVTTMIAALAGFFLQRSTQPAPPGLPTIRAFQRAQALPALRWLRARLDEGLGA